MHGRRPLAAPLIVLIVDRLAAPAAAAAAPGDVTISQVADIRPGGVSSNPNDLFDAGGTLPVPAN